VVRELVFEPCLINANTERRVLVAVRKRSMFVSPGEGRDTILVTTSERGKTPRSSAGDVRADKLRADIRGYYLWPGNGILGQGIVLPALHLF
jgi:hypothetical protein